MSPCSLVMACHFSDAQPASVFLCEPAFSSKDLANSNLHDVFLHMKSMIGQANKCMNANLDTI